MPNVNCFKNLNGYHGTFLDCVNDIVSNGFKPKKRNDHWLGQGVYFYHNDIEQAKVWSKVKRNIHVEYKGKKIAVLEANIVVNTKYFLNINKREELLGFLGFVSALLFNDDGLGVNIKEQNMKTARCLFFDLYSEKYDIQAILGSFSHKLKEVKEIENVIGFNMGVEFHEQQICVKDLSVIKNTSCVFKEVEEYPKTKLGTIEIEKKKGMKYNDS